LIADKDGSAAQENAMHLDNGSKQEGTSKNNYYIGDSAGPSVYRPGMEVYRAVNEGVVTDWSAMERIVEHTMR
jgi:actin-related protein